MRNKFRIGLIVNPIAGMGGSVGLKGTDGRHILAEARARGAVPCAPARAVAALMRLDAMCDAIELLAAPGDMGEDEARAAGLAPRVIGSGGRETTAEDTRRAAAAMAAEVDLLLFAGGDGTARDVLAAIDGRLPVIGIPAGVKMHSAVYATSPQAAADLLLRHLHRPLPLRDLEVMDIDEELYRQGAVSAALFGYLKVPFDAELVQGVKIGRVAGEEAMLQGIAAEIGHRLEGGRLGILGPGTTTRAIADSLGLAKTLLGVDIVRDGGVIKADATEADILRAVQERPGCIVVTPIGGQGHFLGRGNQQISPRVLRCVGLDNLLVVATPAKLAALHGQTLRVDSGDAELDARLCGYRRVITGEGTEAICRVTR
jgi:predicted polyphosphate/ATP-dependent NAD kinase